MLLRAWDADPAHRPFSHEMHDELATLRPVASVFKAVAAKCKRSLVESFTFSRACSAPESGPTFSTKYALTRSLTYDELTQARKPPRDDSPDSNTSHTCVQRAHSSPSDSNLGIHFLRGSSDSDGSDASTNLASDGRRSGRSSESYVSCEPYADSLSSSYIDSENVKIQELAVQ